MSDDSQDEQQIKTPGNVQRFPIPATINLCIAAVQVLGAFVIFYVTSLASAWWQILALSSAFGLLGNSIYATIHEAEHGILHPTRWINDTVGVLLALLFPAPFHLIRQGHIGHHRRNRSDDEAFDLYFEGDRPWLKWLILYGILTGCYWILVAISNVVVAIAPSILNRRFFEFDRPSVAFMDSLNPGYRWMIQLEGMMACALHAIIVWSLEIPLLHYFLVYFGFGFSWSAMQYVHHFGTERHVLKGTRNVWLFAPIDFLWLNHNWHRAHHEQPTVPWIYLPTLSAELDATDREFLLTQYVRMWRGPRKTHERVENKYAGKIIQ
ncbi:MAG: fatty acid desaturase [Planctomycetaceae bacterium]